MSRSEFREIKQQDRFNDLKNITIKQLTPLEIKTIHTRLRNSMLAMSKLSLPYDTKLMKRKEALINRVKQAWGTGRMVISDLVTDKQIAEDPSSIDPEKWCSCIDGALTKDNYIASIKKGGFENVEVLDEKIYTEGDQVDNRRISSLVIKAVKE